MRPEVWGYNFSGQNYLKFTFSIPLIRIKIFKNHKRMSQALTKGFSRLNGQQQGED